MNRFLDQAASILDVAESAAEAGHTPSEITVLIGPDGRINLVADSDWDLGALLYERGSAMAYRVSSSREGAVRVEGRSGSQSCRIEAEPAGQVARRLLSKPLAYPLLTAGSEFTPTPSAGTAC
ncbi:MAG: hypothetical protein ACK5AZ_05495 [Bryobacteraceae bacterium]